MKGGARAATALTIWSVLLDQGLDPVSVLGKNWTDSFCKIHSCIRVFPSRAHVAFENCRMSAAGSIRKAWDAITWCGCLNTLSSGGTNFESLLKEFDARSGGRSKLSSPQHLCFLSMLIVVGFYLFAFLIAYLMIFA